MHRKHPKYNGAFFIIDCMTAVGHGTLNTEKKKTYESIEKSVKVFVAISIQEEILCGTVSATDRLMLDYAVLQQSPLFKALETKAEAAKLPLVYRDDEQGRFTVPLHGTADLQMGLKGHKHMVAPCKGEGVKMRGPGNKRMLAILLKSIQLRVEGFFGRISNKFSCFAQIPLNCREDIDLQQNFMLPMQLWNFVHRLQHAEAKASVRKEELASISKEKMPKAIARKMVLEALETRAECYGERKDPVDGPHATQDEDDIEITTNLEAMNNLLRFVPDNCTQEEKEYFLKGLQRKWGEIDIE